MKAALTFIMIFSSSILLATPALSVGDKAPPLKVFKWIKEPAVQSYQTGKIYVLEFGATWCKPCIAAIPHLSDIAVTYREKVQVVSLFVKEFNNAPAGKPPVYVDRVGNFVSKKGEQIKYSVAVDNPDKQLETTWLEAAGKEGIPYSFVINGDGIIAWIGSNPHELRKVIDRLVSHSSEVILTNAPNRSASFSSGEDTLFMALFSKFTPHQMRNENSPFVTNYRWATPGSEYEKKQGTTIVTGESLRRLYYMAYGDTLFNYPLYIDPYKRIYPDTLKYPYQKRAYGKYWYRPLLDVKDSSVFEMDYNAIPNRFNYYLKVPKEKATAAYMRSLMQEDLKRYVGYVVTVETRDMPCWNMMVTPDAKKKLMSKQKGPNLVIEEPDGSNTFRNGEVRDILFQLEIGFGYSTRGMLVHHPECQPPFFDMTGIKGTIDYVYPKKYMDRIKEGFGTDHEITFDEYKELLQTIGIDLVKSTRKMKVVIVHDPEYVPAIGQ